MFISPKTAVTNNWISDIPDPAKQIGSDGIDLTIKSISRINPLSPSVITENKSLTVHRSHELISCEITKKDAWLPDGMSVYRLGPGSYDIEYNEFVTLPEGVAALILLRSSFVRAGHFLCNGLYDQGFSNFAGSVLHVNSSLTVQAGSRLAQIVFVASEGSGQLYAGGYNFQDGDKSWIDAAARNGSTQA